MRLYKLLILPVLMMPFAMTEVMAECKIGVMEFTKGPYGTGYLYDNSNEWIRVVDKWKEVAGKSFSKAVAAINEAKILGVVCGSSTCPKGSTVTMHANHVLYKASKEQLIDKEVTYECNDRNAWVEYVPPKVDEHCVDESGKRTVNPGFVKLWNCDGGIGGKAGKIEHAKECRAVCGGVSPGVWAYGVFACEDDYEPAGPTSLKNGIYNRCEKKGTGKKDPQPKPDPDQKKKGGGSDCLNRPTAEGRACCRAGGATTFKNNVCTCVDTTKEWKYTEGQEYGQCVAKGSTEVINPCDAICTSFANINVSTTCAAKSVTSVIAQIDNECHVSNRAKCNGENLQKLVTQVEVAVASCANQPVEPEKPQLNEQRLAAAVEAIDKYRSGLDVSVWKDAEGNFNTARLVSDSIAGVVLGTTGALITSSVVKKNQVKNGFEDVVCTILGQPVGSYGDEISVGIQ